MIISKVEENNKQIRNLLKENKYKKGGLIKFIGCFWKINKIDKFLLRLIKKKEDVYK